MKVGHYRALTPEEKAHLAKLLNTDVARLAFAKDQDIKRCIKACHHCHAIKWKLKMCCQRCGSTLCEFVCQKEL